MFARLSTALIFGLIFVLLLDFLLFVGLKLNYFNHYGIDLYFNTLFADNQPYVLLVLLGIALGYAMLYFRGSKIFDRIYIALVVLFALIFYPPVGKRIGEFLFAQKGQYLKLLDRDANVDILYRGRDGIYVKRTGARTVVKYRYEEVEFNK